ncbi:MAG: hypothetical protein ACO3DH_09005 [Candidatus Kapaibacteriota bacterium]
MRRLVQSFVLGVMGILFATNSYCAPSLTVFPNPAYAGDIVSLVVKDGNFKTNQRLDHKIKVGLADAQIISVESKVITFRVPIQTMSGEMQVTYELDDFMKLETTLQVRKGAASNPELPSGFDPDPSRQYGQPIEAGKNPHGLPRGPVVFNPAGGHANTPYLSCAPMHVIDGRFSGSVAGKKNEWSDIIPIKGKFANLYMDYCSETGTLYVLSDWDFTSKQPDPASCFSYLELVTGDGNEHWEIKIHNDVKQGFIIKRNGIDVSTNSGMVEGARYSFSASPMAPFSHTIYEFAIKVKPGNFMMPVYSNPVESTGPIVRCNDSFYGLVKDPSYFHGNLTKDGIELRKDERYVPLSGVAGLTTESMVIAGTLGKQSSNVGKTGSVNQVANCLSKHEIDGKFTRFPDGSKEWSTVMPASGRFSDLYADYCDGTLYILNDWVHGSEEPDKENCYNLFELTTGGGTQHWGIYVYHSLRKGIRVFLNGEDVSFDTSIVKGGKFGMDSSIRDKSPHTVYEFAIKAKEGPWKMFFSDPGPSSFCDNEGTRYFPRSINSNETGFAIEGDLTICREVPFGNVGMNFILNPLRIENKIDKPKENKSVIVLRTLNDPSEWGGSQYEVTVDFGVGYLVPIDVELNPISAIGKNMRILSKQIHNGSVKAIIDAPDGFTSSGELIRIICKSDNIMKDTTMISGSLSIKNESRTMRTVPIQNGYAINDRKFAGNSDDFSANIIPIAHKDGDYLITSFSLFEEDQVSIKIYDETGRVLRSMPKKQYYAGEYTEQLSLNGLQKGMLYVMFTTGKGKTVTVPFVNKD